MSSLRVNAITDTSGGSTNLTVSGKNTAKAWVSFNGTGTVAIRSQFNVSSITDRGVGIYTVNFSSALADANYAVVSAGSAPTAYGADFPIQGPSHETPTSASVRIACGSNTNALADWDYVSVAIFGN